MKGELIINGIDAFENWGVNMGKGFISNLCGIVALKEFIENESRLEHGKRVLVLNPKLSSRDVVLPFTIMGSSRADFKIKKNAFFDELYNGKITIKIPNESDNVYHLIYTGKSIQYLQNKSMTFAELSAKFIEPNPSNRT